MTHTNVAQLPVAAHRRSRVGEVMRPPAHAVGPDTPVAAAATLLAGAGCSGLPVVDQESRVIGLVTETDLVRHRLRHTVPGSVVRDVMTEQPLLAPADHDLDALVGLMLAAGTPVVPVVHGRRLVGSVDLRDLVGLIGVGGARTPEPRRASGQ